MGLGNVDLAGALAIRHWLYLTEAPIILHKEISSRPRADPGVTLGQVHNVLKICPHFPIHDQCPVTSIRARYCYSIEWKSCQWALIMVRPRTDHGQPRKGGAHKRVKLLY